MFDHVSYEDIHIYVYISIEIILLQPWPEPGLVLDPAEHVAEALLFDRPVLVVVSGVDHALELKVLVVLVVVLRMMMAVILIGRRSRGGRGRSVLEELGHGGAGPY